MADEYEIGGETFRHNQRVNIWAKLNNGSHRRLSGTLYTVVMKADGAGEAFVDTPYGIFVGDVKTLEAEED